MLLPHYISYKVFQDGRIFAENIKLGTRASRAPRVAHSTDTSQDLNGVALTLSKVAAPAQRHKKDNTYITCHSGATVSGGKAFRPVEVYSLPGYPALKLALPPA